jgi:hypothetical protein
VPGAQRVGCRGGATSSYGLSRPPNRALDIARRDGDQRSRAWDGSSLRQIAGVRDEEKAVNGADGVLVEDGDPLDPRICQHVLDHGRHRSTGYAPPFQKRRCLWHHLVPVRPARPTHPESSLTLPSLKSPRSISSEWIGRQGADWHAVASLYGDINNRERRAHRFT